MNHLLGIPQLRNSQTRLITAENVYGEKGRGGMAEPGKQQPEAERIGQLYLENGAPRELGRTFKVRPCITLDSQSVTTLMDVEGPAAITHIWITVDMRFYRDLILRMYWDGEETPSVEVPLGDFFCCSWKQWTQINGIPINVNSSGGLNCFFPMPFRTHGKITVENLSPEQCHGFYYAISYELREVACGEAYFHAQFRRTNPLKYKEDYVILDGVKGKGHYVGTQMSWRSEGRYLPLQDDISSVAYWYQAEPHAPFPKLAGRDELEII
ncbi:MAG: DUF2961 domain-containing protein [Lachnospiraceae bacterium]|nr:DUF2961 domain-containing protein [Lachnospiraceae bacterium]